MQRRWWLSASAMTVMVGLALGSAGGDSPDEPSAEVPVVPLTPENTRTPTRAPEPPSAADAEPDRPEPPGAGEAPEGQCCCSFTEADAPVTRFFDEAMCKRVQGTCHRDISVCVAYQKELEAQADTCCCAATEQIQPLGTACEGECYEFYEQGDTPGSCIY